MQSSEACFDMPDVQMFYSPTYKMAIINISTDPPNTAALYNSGLEMQKRYWGHRGAVLGGGGARGGGGDCMSLGYKRTYYYWITIGNIKKCSSIIIKL